MTISLGIGTIFALFHTSGTIPSFRDTLNISVMAGVNYSKTNTVNQSTSFPGSSLLWRKDPGWSWSREPQILGVNLKMYLGRSDRRASLLCLKILHLWNNICSLPYIGNYSKF